MREIVLHTVLEDEPLFDLREIVSALERLR
jgi:hypothetical protein